MIMESLSEQRYVLGEEIGSGTYGTVHKVKRQDGKIFAFKKFAKEDSEFDLGALREISILQILKNSNEGFIHLEDIIISEKYFGIIMKHYSTDLYCAIKNNILNKSSRSRITKQLLKSLAFLKENGIIHRDIKPANILLQRCTKKGFYPVLADYSLSKVFTGVSTLGSHTGNIATKTYRAPEICNQTFGYYGFPADAWSLGIVLYEMYTSKELPVDEDSDAIKFIRTNIPKLKNNYTGLLIKGLLQINPAQRMTPMEALQLLSINYTPRIIWNCKKYCKVSPEIIEWCDNLDIEKEITKWAAQTYYEKIDDCDYFNAVIFAAKIYETELLTYDDNNYDEKNIIIGMNFNLFV